MGKMQVKPWIVNIAKKLLIELSNVPQMCLKLLQKEQFKKTVEAACDLISNRMYDKITKFEKIHITTIRKQLEMRMIKKYVTKRIYF